MPNISKYVREAVRTQLADATVGYNARLESVAESYGIEDVKDKRINFAKDSTNFLFGRISPDALEQSSVLTYPLMTIASVRCQNTNRVKFATFSGGVQVVIEVHHSWPDSAVIGDFDSEVDATEDVVIACLNAQNAQAWPPNLGWNGQVAATRSGIRMGGYGWLMTIQFLCTFELNVL